MSRSPTPSLPARNRGWPTGFSTASPAPCAAPICSVDVPSTTIKAGFDQVDTPVPAPPPNPLPVDTGRGRDPREAWEGGGLERLGGPALTPASPCAGDTTFPRARLC